MQSIPSHKQAVSAVLEALVCIHVESGGSVAEMDPQVAPRVPNFKFDALNKSKNCGAARGGINHNAQAGRVVK